MKTNHLTNLITVAFSLAAFSTTGRAQYENVPAPPSPPANHPAATTAASSTATSWLDIQDCTYDTRARFFAGLHQLEGKVDREMRELAAKRATMNSATTDTKDWDFAMKEMESARSYLKSMDEELRAAPRETWDQEKDKVGQAWVRTQNAYKSVKSSTTD